MADDTGIAEQQPADDIRSALASALAEHDAPEPAAKAAPEKPAAKAEDTGDGEPAARKGPAKGPDGKFIKAEEDETSAAEKPEDGEPEKATDEKAGEEKSEDEALAEKPIEAPANWSGKDKEMFKAQSPEAKQFLLKRHQEMEAGFTKKTQEIAAFRKEYEPVHKLLEPYQDQMKQAGFTPSTLIQSWANVEKRLMDPNDRINVVAGLIKGYQIDMGKVAQALGLRPMQRQAAPDGEQPAPVSGQQQIQLPPEITQQLRTLQQRLDDEDRRRATETRRAQTSAEQAVMNDIEKFKSAQDDKGQLLHPHFEELEEEMTSLAQAAIAAKRPVPSLRELYEKAVFANPSTRDAAVAAKIKAQRDADAEKARVKAAAAKKAASSVTGAPGSGQAPSGRQKAEQSLREQLLEAAAESNAA